MDLENTCATLKNAAAQTATLSARQKNAALKTVADALDANRATIIAANAIDVQKARESGMKESLVDRLLLNDARIDGIIESIHIIIAQTDPIGAGVSGFKTENGLTINQVRVPLGVVAIIYENRPNVTVDAFALAYKSGNAILLRGSSSAQESNKCLVSVIQNALKEAPDGVADAIALSVCDSHDDVNWILNAVGKVDVVLPRGGAKLIQTVVQNARVPVIETGSGVCHLYVDASADVETAARIAENGKLQRPGVCNALETCLVHRDCAETFLPRLYERFAGRAELRCCNRSFEILSLYTARSGDLNRAGADVLNRAMPDGIRTDAPRSTRADILRHAADEDYGFEFLDNILAIKVVDSIDEAINHINTHNTKHSEAIVTKDFAAARAFQAKVDAACVYVNASTRFTDGGVFGFGAELGISTQKLHVRGPMGLEALTTTKYLIDGEGHIR